MQRADPELPSTVGNYPTKWCGLTQFSESQSSSSSSFFFFKIYFIFRERGREREREREKHQGVVASQVPSTGDLACNPGMCPDWELNWQPFGLGNNTQTAEQHQSGQGYVLFCF